MDLQVAQAGTGAQEIAQLARKQQPVPALAGILVTDLAFNVIAADRGASAILQGVSPGAAQSDPMASGNPSLPGELREISAQLQLPEGGSGETSLTSNGFRYACRAFRIEPQNSLLQQPVLVIHMERETSQLIGSEAPTAVYEVAANYHLTERERETLVGISLGLSSKELAKRMDISPNTVRAFLRLIMIKMEVSTRAGLVAKILSHAQTQQVRQAS